MARRTLLVEARAHGRVLVRGAQAPLGLLLGFHGYMETAEIQMKRLEDIEGTQNWTLVSVQGLNRFYWGRSEEVVAGWMTRQDRDAAIDDNIDYVNRVVAVTRVADEPVVLAGFSQGVATAFRAAVRGAVRAAGVMAVGGDVPPELLADPSTHFPRVLLARGERDDWYTADKLEADLVALRSRGVPVEAVVYAAAHEWSREVSQAAGAFLRASGAM